MRHLALALLAGCGCAIGVATAIQAADLDYGVLRGADYDPPAPVVDWSGVYIGGHGGYSSTALNSASGIRPILDSYFYRTTLESELQVSGLLSNPAPGRFSATTYGAYAGYNIQIDDTVLGVEVDYTYMGRGKTLLSDPIGRVFTTSTGMRETVMLAGASRTEIEDYGTIRGRAGYAIGNILPYVTGGLAIGRATISDSAVVQSYGYNANTYTANLALPQAQQAFVANHGYASFNQSNPAASVPNDPETRSRFTQPKSKTVGGIAVGAGVEFALSQNVVLRGEYQYVLFNDFDGHKVNVNTVRGGAAVKF